MKLRGTSARRLYPKRTLPLPVRKGRKSCPEEKANAHGTPITGENVSHPEEGDGGMGEKNLVRRREFTIKMFAVPSPRHQEIQRETGNPP